jgi:hypothetical protein
MVALDAQRPAVISTWAGCSTHRKTAAALPEPHGAGAAAARRCSVIGQHRDWAAPRSPCDAASRKGLQKNSSASRGLSNSLIDRPRGASVCVSAVPRAPVGMALTRLERLRGGRPRQLLGKWWHGASNSARTSEFRERRRKTKSCPIRICASVARVPLRPFTDPSEDLRVARRASLAVDFAAPVPVAGPTLRASVLELVRPAALLQLYFCAGESTFNYFEATRRYLGGGQLELRWADRA